MNEHTKKSEDRRVAYRQRWLRAMKDGGRPLGDSERGDLLGKARDVAHARMARLSERMKAEFRGEPPSLYDKESLELLHPGHVAVRAEALLGFEVEFADALATREAAEQHRMQLLGLMRRASVAPGPGEVDLFKLETALESGKGLPRNAEAQLLEVVRELIRWRAAVPQ